MDGITINRRHSWLDFGLYIKEREIGLPQRRSVRKSVPYCHGSFDFSAIGGEVVYDDRQISYVFDVTGDSIEALEHSKAQVCAWLMETQESEIRDDARPYLHFVGSLGKITWDPDENGLQGELGVTFDCYPFAVSDEARTVRLTGAGPVELWLEGACAVLEAVADQDTTVTDGTLSDSLSASVAKTLDFTLRHGVNTLRQTGSGTVIFTYHEEVV